MEASALPLTTLATNPASSESLKSRHTRHLVASTNPNLNNTAVDAPLNPKNKATSSNLKTIAQVKRGYQLDHSLAKRLKVYAAEEELKINDVVNLALKEYLDKRRPIEGARRRK